MFQPIEIVLEVRCSAGTFVETAHEAPVEKGVALWMAPLTGIRTISLPLQRGLITSLRSSKNIE